MLENGTVFEGIAAGDFKETVCEIVFNTAMTGYVELLTEPTYAGQGLVMSYPMIGNYGVNKEDFQGEKLFASALLVHELCDTPSNFRNEMTIEELLKEYSIPCVTKLDTRAIVKTLRDFGTMKGIITSSIENKSELLEKISSYKNENLLSAVTTKEKTVYNEGGSVNVAVLDLGVKKSIISAFTKRDCKVTVYPAFTDAQEILNDKPDGIFLSNGPGSPTENESIINTVKSLFESEAPLFAVGLGHQILALANGGKVEKMTYGHRGVSQPVKDVNTENTYLSSQGHGYCVSLDGKPENSKISWVNVNDNTVEGLKYNEKAFSVQFHPETDNGPRNTSYLYDEFIKTIKEER